MTNLALRPVATDDAPGGVRDRPAGPAGPAGPPRDQAAHSEDVCCPAGSPVPLDPTAAHELATLLKVLADPVRLQLLAHIAASPGTTVCACHLPTSLGISQPTLSHHLKKLTEARLVTRERRGRWAHYTLVEATMAQVRATLDWPRDPSSCC